MQNKILEVLTQMDMKADERHSEVFDRLNRVDSRLDGIAKQFEQSASDRITDNDYINHKLNSLEKEIFQLKKVL